MKRVIWLCTEQKDFARLAEEVLSAGWVLDPVLGGGRPLVVEGVGVVYHLVKYEEGESPPEAKPGEFDDVVETRELPHGPVPEGFTVHAIYQKNLIAVRRRTVGVAPKPGPTEEDNCPREERPLDEPLFTGREKVERPKW